MTKSTKLNAEWSKHFEKLFYSRSDEKQTLRNLLHRIFQGKQFYKAADIGCGPGLLTGTLACRTKQLTLVEPIAAYSPQLRKRFPNARIIGKGIEQCSLERGYDAILMSHVLYYLPPSKWLETCKRLFDLLNPGGQLVIAMNRDSGDWWKVIDAFDTLKRFHYRPWCEFEHQLQLQFPRARVIGYGYKNHVSVPLPWLAEFLGRIVLNWSDEKQLTRFRHHLDSLGHQFQTLGQRVHMEWDCRLLVLSK